MADLRDMPESRQADFMADGPSKAGRPMTELESKIDAARKEDREIRAKREITPDSMPQVERELSLVTGVLDGVESALARLIVKLEPVSGPGPAYAEKRAGDHDWPITAEMASQLHGLYVRLADIETQISIATARVEV